MSYLKKALTLIVLFSFSAKIVAADSSPPRVLKKTRAFRDLRADAAGVVEGQGNSQVGARAEATSSLARTRLQRLHSASKFRNLKEATEAIVAEQNEIQALNREVAAAATVATGVAVRDVNLGLCEQNGSDGSEG